MHFLFRLRSLFRREKLEADMAAEMRAHLDEQARRNLAAGMSPDDASAAARRQFGGVAQMQEQARDARGFVWLEQFAQDLRYAARALRKHPGFTITAVLTLSLGIGVNTALFTFVNAVALRPLPVREPDQLVMFRRPGTTGPRFSHQRYLDYKESSPVFSGLVAWFDTPMRLDSKAGEAPDALLKAEGRGSMLNGVSAQFVSENYFTVLGATMLMGRGFLPEENRAPQSHPVIVLSHLFWERQLHSDPNVLGTTISLSGKNLTVIGVTSPEFVGHQPAPPAGWLPYMMAAQPATLANPEFRPYHLFGRLKADVSVSQARADLQVVEERLAGTASAGSRPVQPPPLDPGMKFMNLPANAETLAAVSPIVLAFVLVLVIACTNVANLLFARGITRQQEIGVRLALGAGRGRMIRQLLTENLLLCACGAIGGLLLAQWTMTAVMARLPATWGRAGEIRHWRFLEIELDHRVVACAVLLTLAAALAAGLAPALHAARANLLSALKEENSVFGLRLSQSRVRHLLVISQVAICLMLLSCAGVLGRNLFALRQLDPGFDPRAVFQVYAGPRVAPADRQAALAAHDAVMETIRALPGVSSACAVMHGPMLGVKGSPSTTVTAEDSTGINRGPQPLRYGVVSPEYFDTFGIPLLRGRGFTPQDAARSAPVVVITESLARHLWSAADAVGRTLAVSESAFPGSSAPKSGERLCTVIGIARDVRNAVMDPEQRFMFLPLSPGHGLPNRMYVRPRSDSATALAALARQADAAGVELQLEQRIASQLEESMAPFILLAWLSGVLGGLALLMASVGLYGVMAFMVGQRGREIGIRIALGATAAKVTALFLRQGMKLVAAGMIVGLAGGGLFALVLRKVVFGLGSAFDPLAFGAVTALFAAIALFACWLPTRRATKVDPMVALRAE